jgi:hypothetical protein
MKTQQHERRRYYDKIEIKQKKPKELITRCKRIAN